jgi:hypothetical protein
MPVSEKQGGQGKTKDKEGQLTFEQRKEKKKTSWLVR